MEDYVISGGRLTVNCDLYGGLEEFKACCDKLIETGEKELIVDLSGVGSMFSPYLSAMVQLSETAAEQGRRVKVIASPKVMKMLETAGLVETLNVEAAGN